jgi:hypothetical protein
MEERKERLQRGIKNPLEPSYGCFSQIPFHNLSFWTPYKNHIEVPRLRLFMYQFNILIKVRINPDINMFGLSENLLPGVLYLILIFY